MKTFEELDCYKMARELRKHISAFARMLPAEEKFGLKSQIIRSSRSVTANIAEGYGRHHHQENLQYCRQARGSLTETLDHLNVALDEEYLDVAAYAYLRKILEETWQILNGYIAYVSRCAIEGTPSKS